jgi:phospholipase/lecithinase/hemolysin
MTSKRIRIVTILTAAVLIAAACSPATPAAAPTAGAATLATTVIVPTATLAPTALPSPLPPTAAPTVTPLPPTALPPTATTAAEAPFTHIYAFGDSYSDNGNGAKLLGSDWSANAYWQGRASNGPAAVEVLAAQLNVPLTDYAVDGARSGHDNAFGNDKLAKTGGLAQVVTFRQDLKGTSSDPNALYFVELGANDFFAEVFGNPNADITSTTDSTADNIVTLVQQLAVLGAKHVLVIPALDQASMPVVVANAGSAEARQFEDAINSKVATRLAALGAQQNLDIKLFDLVALSTKIRAHPSDYGLTNLTDPCQVTDPQVLPACATPDQYYFWDAFHPTRRVHQIFGEAWAALYQP